MPAKTLTVFKTAGEPITSAVALAALPPQWQLQGR